MFEHSSQSKLNNIITLVGIIEYLFSCCFCCMSIAKIGTIYINIDLWSTKKLCSVKYDTE